MAISNHERIGRALKLLHDGLYPYFEREMEAKYTRHWLARVASMNDEDSLVVKKKLKNDLHEFLRVMWQEWNDVFRKTLGKAERSLLSECQDIRNSWAHNSTASTDDTYRALDSIGRLLSAVSAPEAETIEKQKQELLRVRFQEQAKRETRRAVVNPTQGQPAQGLKPWREIVTPHQDVAKGYYQQAEFAADLWQVYLDEGSDEYRDPTEFFRRTYLTEGLKQLLMRALLRLSGKGGDPVVELQTNFGGGKTHALLALYHLCHALKIPDLPDTESLFQEAGLDEPPQNVNVAVLVGNKLPPSGISPDLPHHKGKNRPFIRTLWGELAWQLGGAEGYELVRQADETATNPGDALKTLFNRFSPCLILIDEWVSYARQLHEDGDLAGGTFDTQFTFAQTLSESAKNAKDTLLVVSIPASDIEKGGEKGHEATERLKNAIGRVESPWRPASAEESFEIVRRRLFQSTTDPNLLAQRDGVVRGFWQMYKSQSQEFPAECGEKDYERRLREAYPIHPELFDRLYEDWSTLDKFQRTRGVLRLMAKVIHSLWERGDRSLLILPAHIPIDDSQVQSELTRYLEDNWTPVIDKDVDGPNSLPLERDRTNPNLGRYSACRRVARTIYMGSAPTLRAANLGLEDRRIKLGCVQPGESVATFSDALRRLTDQATYLYVDGSRYWISTQPNVNRTAQERATQYLEDHYPVQEEIIKRLKQYKSRGEFNAVHIAPESTADIPDDAHLGVRLVVLGPGQSYGRNQDSPAHQWLTELLNSKGNSPRYYKNTLLFLAPDQGKIENLERNVAQSLAWQSILKDQEILNLDAFQNKQANTKCDSSTKYVEEILADTYQWLLVPTQPDTQGGIKWDANRLQGKDYPIVRASAKAVHEDYLLTQYAATILRLEVLDSLLWVNSNHLNVKKLWDYLTQYLYLPRLKNPEVLLKSIRDGVNSTIWTDHFAYAEGFDEETGRYLNLQAGTGINPSISPHSLIVKPDIAQKQLEAERQPEKTINSSQPQSSTLQGEKTTQTGAVVQGDGSETQPDTEDIKPTLTRFHGNVNLDGMRINRDASTIANEVIQHLTALNGAKVKITLEIDAELPEGVPDDVVRTVIENCKTLKFQAQSFESE
ncbi:Swt1 family HEPN domain-containing protein [Spirulina sp. CS-785/01]|uniref:Swt1 family HEPN domain-containing protein n=1 Tax=Spirulina sp. CS-785/01 TaxID=3021716 RepID=UPI00232DBABA|nr:Swt1 family HEPN domain-containing protein [Spirulina sp. CS-785/01]MDB9312538.1 Swt1 family HEPN domain-containing protein [Spirulina sp. CS-785/01]